MLIRILTAFVALALFIPLMIFGGVWGACALFAVITALSVFEMLECCGLVKKLYITVPAVILSTLVPVSEGLRAWYTYQALLVSSHTAAALHVKIPAVAAAVAPAVLCLALLWVVFVATLGYNKVDSEKLFMFFGLAVYITLGFLALLRIRYYFFEYTAFNELGLKLFAFTLIVAWGTDTFAYFFGVLFGKKKLCPEISPKKTFAGAVGGTLLGSAAGALFLLLTAGTGTLCIVLACCAPLLSGISQFGDLAASVIQRKFGVKDYGRIFPGHGGVLDRFDSVLSTAIAVWLIISIYDNAVLFAG